MRLYIFFLFSVDCKLKHLIKHNSLFLEKLALWLFFLHVVLPECCRSATLTIRLIAKVVYV